VEIVAVSFSTGSESFIYADLSPGPESEKRPGTAKSPACVFRKRKDQAVSRFSADGGKAGWKAAHPREAVPRKAIYGPIFGWAVGNGTAGPAILKARGEPDEAGTFSPTRRGTYGGARVKQRAIPSFTSFQVATLPIVSTAWGINASGEVSQSMRDALACCHCRI